MQEIIQQIGKIGIVPVVAIESADSALPFGQALMDGGLPCAEITFRTDAAAESIYRLAKEFPEMLVGAGTVLTVAQAEQAKTAGAKFIVTPGFDAAVVDWCISHEMPITPGVITPTEINMALNKGISLLKFFPAEASGGVKMLKAISAPYGGVTFIPTGGIGLANLADYLSLPSVHACGGSWMVTKSLISNGEFETITRLASEAVSLVKQIRG